MKRNQLWTFTLVAVCTCGAHAQDNPAGKAANNSAKGDGAAQMQQKLLQQFDANKDGVLNDQEKLAANEYLRRMGVLGGVEPGGIPAFEQFAKQFDKDGDGKLSDQEKLMAQAAFQRIRNKGGKGPAYGIGYGGQAGAGGFAPNVGGAAGAGGEAPAPKVSALVKRFDKDGDGKLNDEEKATAQAELQKKDKKEPKAKAEKDK